MFDKFQIERIKENLRTPALKSVNLPPEFPTIVWKDEYMTADGQYTDAFKYIIQSISDILIRRQGCIYEGNPNNPRHYGVFWGHLDEEVYKEATSTYGRKGPAQLHDFNLFHNPISQIMGRLSEAPYEIQVKNLTRDSQDARINKNADILSERYIRKVAEMMQSDTGKSMDFAIDPSMYIPKGNDELLQFLTTSEQVEENIYYILEAVMADRRTRPNIIDCYQDLFIINAQAAKIAVYEDIIIPEHVHPHTIGIIGRMDVDDPIATCQAAGVHKWRTIAEAVEKNSVFLMNHPHYNDPSKLIQSIMLETNHQYNPSLYAFGPNPMIIPGAGIPASGDLTGDPLIDEAVRQNAWMGDNGGIWDNMFYKNAEGPTMILEQEGYVKVMGQQRALVKVNGKNPTEGQLQAILRMKEYERNRNGVKFDLMEKDQKLRKDEKFIKVPVAKWLSWVRLGHNILIDLGEYRYMKPKLGKQADARLPIIVNNVRQKSIVSIGEWYAQVDNTVMLILAESLNRTGADNALRINKSLIPDDMDIAEFLHFVKKDGIIIEGEPINPEDKGRSAVSGVRVGTDGDRLVSLLTLHTALRQTFDLVVGPVSAATFANTNGLGEKQVMGQQGGMALQYSLWRNTLFNNQVFQRIADIAKYEYKDADGKILYLGNAQYYSLKETADLDLQDDLKISVQIGSEARDERQMLVGMIPQIASAQNPMEVFELLIQAYYTTNPKQILSHVRKAMDEVKQRQAQEAQVAQEQQQAQIKIEQDRVTQPVQAAQIAAQAKLAVEDKKAEREQMKLEGKGMLSDADLEAEMQLKVADKILNPDEKTES